MDFHDPAADFLAREQNELGDLGDELGLSTNQECVPDEVINNGTTEPAVNDSYSAIRQVDVQEIEPEKIKIWRQEFQARIERMDNEEAIKKDELEKQAQKELNDWRRQHEERITKTHVINREQDASMIHEQENTEQSASDKNIWERVCNYCEFNPPKTTGIAQKSGNTLSNTKDVSRMRAVLLQLKQQPIMSQ